MRRNNFTRLSSLNLREVLGGTPSTGSNDPLQRIVRAWPAVVETSLAERCRPVLFRADRLTVQADSPVWANRFRHQSLGIMHQLSQTAQLRIGEIRVQVAASAPAPKPLPPAPRRPGAEVSPLLAAGAEDLEDDQLRAAVERLSRTLKRR